MKNFLCVLLLTVSTLSAAARPEWSAALKESIRGHFPRGARIEVDNVRTSLSPAQRFRIWGFSPEMPLGLVGFQVETEVSGKILKSSGTATVRVFVPVAVARSPLNHGEQLDGANIGWEEREISRFVAGGYFTDKGALIGRSAKGYISIGQTLGRSNTQQPLDVAAGQTVELKREKGSLRLTAKVRAMQGGTKNQWIQVQNPSTGKILLARISAHGEVTVQ